MKNEFLRHLSSNFRMRQVFSGYEVELQLIIGDLPSVDLRWITLVDGS